MSRSPRPVPWRGPDDPDRSVLELHSFPELADFVKDGRGPNCVVKLTRRLMGICLRANLSSQEQLKERTNQLEPQKMERPQPRLFDGAVGAPKNVA